MLCTFLSVITFIFGASAFYFLSWFGLHLLRSAHLVTALNYAEAVGVAFGLYSAIVIVVSLTVVAIELLRDWQGNLRPHRTVPGASARR